MNKLVPINDADMMPAHLQAVFGSTAGNSDLASGVSAGYQVLSFKGKTWAVAEGGDRHQITKPDDPTEPALSLDIVLVKSNPNLSKVYYDHGYVEGSDEKPTCYSHNGTTPANDATNKQALQCAVCPHNQWGSRITETSSKGKACSDSRRIALVSIVELDKPMLLRVPAASLKDLAIYAETLARRNAPYQSVLTRVGFDHSVAHPKLTFQAKRWLTAEEGAKIAETMKLDVVRQIVGEAFETAPRAINASVDALGDRPAHVAPAAQEPVPVKKEPKLKKAAAPVVEAEVVPTPAPVEAKPAKPAKAAKPALVIEESPQLDQVASDLDDMLAAFDD